MSDIKIQPSATGSATVTLTAPATGTARTVTLPDSTATLLASEGAVTINESGADVDFRVESDTNANALFLQGSDGKIGIGTNSPTSVLEISGTGAQYSKVANGSNKAYMGVAGDNKAYFGSFSATDVVLAHGTSNKWTLNSSGNLFPAATSQGIVLGNTSDVAANRLDDYEEGTWTPTLTGTSGGPSGVNFVYRLGWYTKIGRVVIADCRLAMSSWSSGPSGSALISGLPFNAPASSNYFASPTIGYTHNFDSDNAPKGGFVEEGSSVIRLIKANDSDARQVFSQNVSASALNGDETIFVSVAYIVSA